MEQPYPKHPSEGEPREPYGQHPAGPPMYGYGQPIPPNGNTFQGSPSGPGYGDLPQKPVTLKPYVISLIAGLPTMAVALFLLVTSWGQGSSAVPIIYAGTLGIPATMGTVLAFKGMNETPRKFPLTALLLTVIPAGMIAGFILFAVLLIGLIIALFSA